MEFLESQPHGEGTTLSIIIPILQMAKLSHIEVIHILKVIELVSNRTGYEVWILHILFFKIYLFRYS